MVYSTLQRYHFLNTLIERYVKLINSKLSNYGNHTGFSNILKGNLGGIKRYDKD